ncbi:MAG: sortase family protein LPXTG-site transpeptidase [Actinomycetia bacterium]|nr:sortase family protein LPXTG-site transpeptidase [Actinomycetes bacterium]
MEAEAAADDQVPNAQALARAVALLERVGGASLEEARRMRHARAEGSVDEIVESARDRAARILSTVGSSVDRATESEVAPTEEAFTTFSKELVGVRETVGLTRDTVVDALAVPPAPIDVSPLLPRPAAERAGRARSPEPFSAAGAYFSLLSTAPQPAPPDVATAEPEAEPAPALATDAGTAPEVTPVDPDAAPVTELVVTELVVTEFVVTDLEAAEPEVATQPEVTPVDPDAAPTADVVVTEFAVAEVAVTEVAVSEVDESEDVPSAETSAADVAAETPRVPTSRFEIPWFLDPPPPRPGARPASAESTAVREPGRSETAPSEPAVAETAPSVPAAPEATTAEAPAPAAARPPKPRFEIPAFLISPEARPISRPAPDDALADDVLPATEPATAPTTEPAAVADLLPPPSIAPPSEVPSPLSPPPPAPAAAPAPAPVPQAPELMPDAKGGKRHRIRRLLARLFRDTGILLIAFAVLQLWGTGLLQSRSQHQLRAAFAESVASVRAQRARAAALVVSGTRTTVPQVTSPAPARGDAVARLRIPAIGVDQIVVEGTGVAELRQGPGHDPSTPMPGDSGDSVITAHRATYGAPFDHLDQLKVGDRISVTTTTGSATYEVSDSPKTVSGDALPNAAGDDGLILTTSQPKYRASEQLAVVARLRNPPKGTGLAVAQRATTSSVDGASSWFAGSAWGSLLVWAALMLVVYLAMHRLAVRWRRSQLAIFTLAAVPLAVSAFLFLQAVGRVFPPNY